MSEVKPAGKRLLLVAACALVDTDRRVLLAQRPEGKQLAGLWEFPGGKVEPGELLARRALRQKHAPVGVDQRAGYDQHQALAGGLDVVHAPGGRR